MSLDESDTAMITGFHELFAKLVPKGVHFRSEIRAVHTGLRDTTGQINEHQVFRRPA